MQTPETFLSFADKNWADVDLASCAAGFVPIASTNDVHVYGHPRDELYHQVCLVCLLASRSIQGHFAPDTRVGPTSRHCRRFHFPAEGGWQGSSSARPTTAM